MEQTEIPKKYQSLRLLAQKIGIPDTTVIQVKDVVIANWVRLKCQYGCGSYGKKLTCPPYSPTPDQTRKILSPYQWAILIHGDQNTEMRRLGAEFEREAFLAGYYKAFVLVCGPCHICEECAFDSGCRFPSQARPAMEACGIDVYSTVRAVGMPVEVVLSSECRQDRYALLLLE